MYSTYFHIAVPKSVLGSWWNLHLSTPQSRYWSSPSCFWHRVSSICKGKSGGAVSTTLLLRSVPRSLSFGKPMVVGLALSNCEDLGERKTGWWFQIVFIFHNVWDNPSHWLICFKRVKTTNQQTTGLEPHILCILSYFLIIYVLLALLGCCPVSIRMGLSMF